MDAPETVLRTGRVACSEKRPSTALGLLAVEKLHHRQPALYMTAFRQH